MRQYKLRAIIVWPGVASNLSWISDEEIESALTRLDGELISLEAAASLFFDDILQGSSINTNIQSLGLISYVHSLGYRIDIAPCLE